MRVDYLIADAPGGRVAIETPKGNRQEFDTPARALEYVRWHAKISGRGKPAIRRGPGVIFDFRLENEPGNTTTHDAPSNAERRIG